MSTELCVEVAFCIYPVGTSALWCQGICTFEASYLWRWELPTAFWCAETSACEL